MANALKVITASASDTNGSGADLAADTDRILYKVGGSVTASIIVGFHVSNIVTNTIKITIIRCWRKKLQKTPMLEELGFFGRHGQILRKKLPHIDLF